MLVLHSVHDERFFEEQNKKALEKIGAQFKQEGNIIWVYVPRGATNEFQF